MKARCSMQCGFLGTTVLELAADPKILRDRLAEAMQGAATLGFLIRALFPSPDPESKPSPRIV